MERSQHGGHLLQAVPVLTAGGQPGQQLYVLEVVETVEDRPQQQFGKVELDGFSEPLTRRLQLVSNLRLGKKRVEAVPVTQNESYIILLLQNILPLLRVQHIPSIFLINLELLRLCQLLEARPDGGDL